MTESQQRMFRKFQTKGIYSLDPSRHISLHWNTGVYLEDCLRIISKLEKENV